MALVHTIPETDATVPPAVRASGNGTLPTDWLRSFDGTTRTDFKMFAPVSYAMQALHIAAGDDGVDFDTTGRYRSLKQQEALFLSRYTPGPFDPAVHRTVPSTVRRLWNGQEWYLKKGMAMAATPGTSNHGWGIADDIAEMVGGKVVSITQRGLQWLKDNAGRFGFALDVHEEPWHWHWYRPGHSSELTQETVDVLAAHGVSVPDLSTFGFTAPAPTPPPDEEIDMEELAALSAKVDELATQIAALNARIDSVVALEKGRADLEQRRHAQVFKWVEDLRADVAALGD